MALGILYYKDQILNTDLHSKTHFQILNSSKQDFVCFQTDYIKKVLIPMYFI